MILVQKDLTKHSVLTKNLYIEVHTQLHPATTVNVQTAQMASCRRTVIWLEVNWPLSGLLSAAY